MSELFSRFVSIDIETTGLDPTSCDIIEIGAVIDDWITPLEYQPIFHCYVKRDNYRGQPYALSMHPTIFRRIATEQTGYDYLYAADAVRKLGQWMHNNGAYDLENDERRANVAGKNFAMFDDKFLRLMPKFDEHVLYRHRVIDPAMLYWNPLEDSVLPDTKTCMERAGIAGEVAHTAVEDAQAVVKLIKIAVGRRVQAIGLFHEIQRRNQRERE